MPVISKEEGVTYSDLSGRYLIKLARVNPYILICYNYDSSAILVEALPSRSDARINKGVQKFLDTLTTAGHNPKIRIIDNEACDLLKQTILKQNISYQIVHLYIYLRNSAEISIQTFKDNFITGLCSTDLKYPSQEWYFLLP